MSQSVYDQLIAATSELLGPASARFIDRQIDNHLHIEPRQITSKDVDTLSHWIRLSISMLSDDKETLKDYEAALQELSRAN